MARRIRKTNDISNETDSRYDNAKSKVANITERFDDTTDNDNPYDDAIQYLAKKHDEIIDSSNSIEMPLVSTAFYVNDNPFVQNSLYFGSSLGNTATNWNDPFAVPGIRDGQTMADITSMSISDDDQNWGWILPFDVSKIEIQCSLRPGGSCARQNFYASLWTGTRVNDNSTTSIPLTRRAFQSVEFNGSGNYTKNDFSFTGDLDKEVVIYFGVGTTHTSPAAKNARGMLNIILTTR